MLRFKDRQAPQPPRLALVMSGGGARAAYQVGFLQCLARHFPELRFPIITGVSAGAINAMYLAAHPGSLMEAADDLASIWCNLTTSKVYRTSGPSIGWQVMRWGWRLMAGGSLLGKKARGMVDTRPLRRLLQEQVGARKGPIPGIARNIAEGRLKAVAVATTNYSTGRSVIWVEGRDVQPWKRDNRLGLLTRITVEHVMASTALPFFFPAVRIGNMWYGDGGIRLVAPFSPALELGADRILAVSTRYRESDTEHIQLVYQYPSPAEIVGVLLNAIFLDTLDRDAEILDRITRLVSKLPEEEREGLRPVASFVLRPSVNLARLAGQYEPQLPPTLRFMLKGMGAQEAQSPDWLSMLMFEREYVTRLIEIGRQDAEAVVDQIADVLMLEKA